MSTVIQVENLCKTYRLGAIGGGTLRADVSRWLARAAGRPDPTLKIGQEHQARLIGQEFKALQDVSFEVRQGEILGVIGRNGAGKSTLLKILSRVTAPTRGEVRFRGRIASLLEVGTGFHPELTGRENVFLNGAILGMSKAEIRKNFDEIVAFSGVEDFIDTPVKRYSSGMYVRLAFAVAAHLESEILIVDEVLAVGDADFQKKCMGKMKQVVEGGRTVLFVSHNMSAILNLCTSAAYLEGGRLVCAGDTKSIVGHYLYRALPAIVEGQSLASRKDRTGNAQVKLTSFRIEDDQGRQVHEVCSGSDLFVVLGYETKDARGCPKVDPGISFHTEAGETIFIHYSSFAGKLMDLPGPRGELRFRLERLPLSPGRYVVGSRVTVNGEEADWPRDGVGFLRVEAGDFYGSGSKGTDGGTTILVNGSWSAKN